MSEVIVRIVAGILMVGSIAAFYYSRRMWLSIAQNSLVWSVFASVVVTSLMLLVKPSLIAEPIMFEMPMIVVFVISAGLFWFQQRIALAKIRGYKQLVDESLNNDDPAAVQRWQALTNITVSQLLSLGLIRELRDMGFVPPDASTRR